MVNQNINIDGYMICIKSIKKVNNVVTIESYKIGNTGFIEFITILTKTNIEVYNNDDTYPSEDKIIIYVSQKEIWSIETISLYGIERPISFININNLIENNNDLDYLSYGIHRSVYLAFYGSVIATLRNYITLNN